MREGRSFVVTAHGRPVARILPCDVAEERRRAARDVLFTRLKAQAPVEMPGPRWTRDEPYERG